MRSTSFAPASTSNFNVGDLVINFGAVAVVDGFNHGDLILKIVACEMNGVRQGGAGQRYCAPAANCRMVETADGVTLANF